MGEDAVNIAARSAALPLRTSATAGMHLHGWSETAAFTDDALSVYGSNAPALQALAASVPDGATSISAALPHTRAEVIWAARHEMARTVEDVLARRTRALFLNARAAIEAAPTVAALLATELQKDTSWQEQQIAAFTALAAGYVYSA